MIRKKNGKGLLLLLITGALLMTGSTGCSKQAADTKQKVEGLDKLGQIKVISREEGSGTRGTFAQLAGFVQENTDKDQTVKDAKIADDTASVLNMVGSDQSAIGYGSAGIMVSDSQVKVLSVGGVEPGQNNAGYPLSRSFYLVWNGKLNDVEDDFMRYIRGAGPGDCEPVLHGSGKAEQFPVPEAEGKDHSDRFDIGWTTFGMSCRRIYEVKSQGGHYREADRFQRRDPSDNAGKM